MNIFAAVKNKLTKLMPPKPKEIGYVMPCMVNTTAKKRIFSLFLILITVVTFSNAQTTLKKVVIDAGHGGKDPGAIGPTKVQEKDVALDVSLKLGNMIKDKFPDVQVIYTRNTDVFIGLADRAQIANKANADLFISIHCNSADNKNARGVESWVLGLHKSEAALEVAKKENASILMEDDHQAKYQDFDPKDPDAYIGLALRQNVYLDQSLKFANLFQVGAVKELKLNDRGVRQAGFMVLYRATMPAVLLELGFLSNAEEEKYLGSEKGKKELAQQIFEAFTQYKRSVDGVSGAIEGKNDVSYKPVEDKKLEKDENDITEEYVNGVSFSVQIASSSELLSVQPQNFKGVRGVQYYLDGGLYKYTVGRFAKFADAKSLQKEMIDRGFDSAFVVAFQEGKRIDLKKALDLTKK
ncbi:MAG: N-acetylmuramoyl-L-alanine amidase [Flavobacteriales bacterium]